MEKSIGKWLIDVLSAIREIEGYFDDNPKEYKSFQENMMLKRAVERNLEIIGEAVNRILKKAPDIEISDSKKIVQFRNIIIHNYDNVSEENVWAILLNNIPILKTEVEKLLNTHFPQYPIP